MATRTRVPNGTHTTGIAECQDTGVSKLANLFISNLSEVLFTDADKELFNRGLSRFLANTDDRDLQLAIVTTLANSHGLSRIEGMVLADLRDRLAKGSATNSQSASSATSVKCHKLGASTEETSTEVAPPHDRVEAETKIGRSIYNSSRGVPTPDRGSMDVALNNASSSEEKIEHGRRSQSKPNKGRRTKEFVQSNPDAESHVTTRDDAELKKAEKSNQQRFGAMILEKQGWSPGYGLGDSNRGITKFLEHDERYADFANKRGLGYPDNNKGKDNDNNNLAGSPRTREFTAAEASSSNAGYSHVTTYDHQENSPVINMGTGTRSGFTHRIQSYDHDSLHQVSAKPATNDIPSSKGIASQRHDDNMERGHRSGFHRDSLQVKPLGSDDSGSGITSRRPPSYGTRVDMGEAHDYIQSNPTGFGHPPTNVRYIRARGGADDYHARATVVRSTAERDMWG